jgi:hypothetical protein
MTRVCLTRHDPSSGFLAPSTGSSPSGLADTLGPLPLLGFSLARLFQAERPWCVAAPLCPFVCGALQPRTLRNKVESSADSKALEPFRPGSTAVVPEPLSPLRSTSFPDRREGFRPRSPPLALEPSASGRTMTLRAGAPG